MLRIMLRKAFIIHLDVDLCTVLRRKPDIEYSYNKIKFRSSPECSLAHGNLSG